MLVPQFMATLDESIPADTHTFVWHDQESLPIKLFTDTAAVNDKTREFQEFLGKLRLSKTKWHEVKASVLKDESHPLATKIRCFIADEIRLPLGLPHEAVRFLPTTDEQAASIWLWRSGHKGYGAAELEFVKRACNYLRYALAAPCELTAQSPMVEDGINGVVLLCPQGTLLQVDEVAERLLPIAVDAPYAVSFRDNEELAALWRRLCLALGLVTSGRAGPLPMEWRRNIWGSFAFRASWLQRPSSGNPGMVAATVTLYVPRRIKLWRAIHALGLPSRQQGVALLFAEGMSQSDIAVRLNIARTTVIDHIRRLYDKLGIPANRDALRAHLLDYASLRNY